MSCDSGLSDDWQNNLRSLSERSLHALREKLLCDCEFIVGGERKIECHKLILGLGSPVFQAMFYGSCPPPADSIPIPDISPAVFQQIIEYIYDKEISIKSCKNACDLHYGAKKYMLHYLEQDCIEYIKTNLNAENVLCIYEFAKFHSETSLEKQCMELIQSNTEEILRITCVKELSEETLLAILDLHAMNISSELVLYQLVENWALAKDCSREEGRQLLTRLRLLSLTSEEFAAGPLHSGFLTDSEKLALLLRLTVAVHSPLENGLSNVRHRRRPLNSQCFARIETQDLSDATCDGSEWLTSVFKTNTPIRLLGVELRLQIDDWPGKYTENLMVKIGYAHSKEHFDEAVLCEPVRYNSVAQVLFTKPISLRVETEYALHVFLCRPGVYPMGRHEGLATPLGAGGGGGAPGGGGGAAGGGDAAPTVSIQFISHSSWERAHPYNNTILSALIYTELTQEENVDEMFDEIYRKNHLRSYPMF